MAKNSKTQATSGKRGQTRTAKPVASASVVRDVKPHAYDDRTPILIDEIKSNGAPMTTAALFARVKTKSSGLFGTERRVAATVRAERRYGADARLMRDEDGLIAIAAKSARRNGKAKAKR